MQERLRPPVHWHDDEPRGPYVTWRVLLSVGVLIACFLGIAWLVARMGV
jgi:hypothetical protein